MCMIKQLTGAVGGGGNPFAPSPGGGAMVAQGYKANFLGQDIMFADEAQYLKVKMRTRRRPARAVLRRRTAARKAAAAACLG
jgi:hypothetical protein